MKKIVGIIAAAVALFALTAGGCDNSATQKAKHDCDKRHGVYQKTGPHSGQCLAPKGGWQ